jgi:two-component system, sensor histidine kinase and response regulator
MTLQIKAIILLMLILSARPNLSAQANQSDSLESLVKIVPSDTNKVWLLNTLVKSLREKNNNKALQYAQQAVDLAELLQYKKGLGLALENLGWILYRSGDFMQSYEASTRALKIVEELNDSPAIARLYINIAAIHFEQKQFDKAIENFKESYTISAAIGDKTTMARSLNNIGYSFIKLNNNDSAFKYVQRALAVAESGKDGYLIGFSYRSLGDIYLSQGNIDKSLEALHKCLDISNNIGNTFLKVSTLHRIGKAHNERKDYKNALKYLQENISFGLKNGYKEELEQTYKVIADVYYHLGDLNNAYVHQNLYTNLHDSLSLERHSEQMALVQARFNSEINEAKIDLLTKEAELREEEIKRQKVWLYFYIGCLSLLGILAFVLFYNNRYTRQAKKELEQKNLAIQSQAQELRNINATKDKLFSIISHDLRSPLASLKALVELVTTSGLTQDEFVQVTRVLKRNLDSVHEDLDNLLLWAQTQLKGLQANAEPVNVREVAEEKISLFKEVANAKKLTITNDISHDTVVLADRNHVSLVLRNLLANAIKFNEVGGKIMLSSRNLGDVAEISVTDTGIGIAIDDLAKLFNPETHFTRPGTEKEKGAGIGLLITKEFVENNNGSIWVSSELGKGATFTFALQAHQQVVPA